ncbi:MAG: hypothetical protein QOD77_1536 [Thermoplasmata archaeon]|jgi:archaellum component FlaG (FlaF/FlaG flagellin family)|nr:hypothetical protein [Thermoplasmata archaeon]
MAASSAAEIIIFIGAIVAAAGVATALGAVAAGYTSSLRDRTTSLERDYTTRVAIVNDPGDVDVNPLLLYLKNTGSQDVNRESFVILVDGVPRTFTMTVGGVADTVVKPGELATFTSSGLTIPGSSDHRVVVLAGASTMDELEFSTA